MLLLDPPPATHDDDRRRRWSVWPPLKSVHEYFHLHNRDYMRAEGNPARIYLPFCEQELVGEFLFLSLIIPEEISRNVLYSPYAVCYPRGYWTILNTLIFYALSNDALSVFLTRFYVAPSLFYIRHLVIYARASSLVENNRTSKTIFCAIWNKNGNGGEKKYVKNGEVSLSHVCTVL